MEPEKLLSNDKSIIAQIDWNCVHFPLYNFLHTELPITAKNFLTT